MPVNIISKLENGITPDRTSTQLFLMDVECFLDSLPEEPIFDLVVISPPYNIGKEYEDQMPLSVLVSTPKLMYFTVIPDLQRPMLVPLTFLTPQFPVAWGGM